MNELWKPIKKYPEYWISNLGRVKRIPKPRFMSIYNIGRGYAGVSLKHKDDSQSRSISVHILVAEAFIGKRPKNYDINHKNGIKKDARAINLEYVTHLENVRHAWENNDFGSLTRIQARKIKQLLGRGYQGKWIANKFKVSPSTICDIKNGRTWRRV